MWGDPNSAPGLFARMSPLISVTIREIGFLRSRWWCRPRLLHPPLGASWGSQSCMPTRGRGGDDDVFFARFLLLQRAEASMDFYFGPYSTVFKEDGPTSRVLLENCSLIDRLRPTPRRKLMILRRRYPMPSVPTQYNRWERREGGSSSGTVRAHGGEGDGLQNIYYYYFINIDGPPITMRIAKMASFESEARVLKVFSFVGKNKKRKTACLNPPPSFT